ncbi:CoA pyrophosphatase [Labrys wisconsinensis]|uniref:8-oxo-dGTP pyrophosphatase MutT (NUDIX family) n=1 Tax=Labrys wisconsinensis TaxID=425677 RepID=A0ABU0JJP3_9HYPH|nr:CoA pyrophosphatase [Labrys wisconsinensis]MDQ0473623.1 8-oxo-dGTP pyrophosphatase MutT (NUDIX family) [Labrys wisconsinensis]
MPDPFLADFLARARRRLRPAPPPVGAEAEAPAIGDHSFSPDLAAEAPAGPGKPAAVLIGVVEHPDGATVLLTRRSTALRSHSGQIAFPGGRIDPGDDGPLAAALREAQEEIGLPPAHVAPLGYLDLYLTTSGFRVVPVVALIAPGFALTLNPAEVDEAFECPLAFLMDPANHRRESREWRGAMRSYYAMPFEDRYIWGVTAGILRTLYDRIYA